MLRVLLLVLGLAMPLAACAFANTVLSFFFISAMGLFTAVSIRVSRA